MKLLIVILCYRVPDLTIDCLRSLEPEVPRVPGTRVAVLENGTGGNAADQLRDAIDSNQWGDWVDLTATYPNLGFTGGNNLLIREALASADPPEYFVLLNADTIVRPGAMEALVRFLDSHPRAGVVGSQLLNPEGEIMPSPYRFLGVGTELNRGLRLGLLTKAFPSFDPIPPTPDRNARAEWVSGASMGLRAAMLREIGLLDEGLYTYYDDVDLGWRARQANWEVWYVPESQVVHLEGASTGLAASSPKRRPSYWHQARRRYFLKNFGPVYAAAADAAFLTGFALWRIRRRIQRKPDTDPPHLLADSLRHSVFRTGFQVTDVENPALAEYQSRSNTAGGSAG